MTIDDAVRRLIQDTEEAKRLVENEPSQESLITAITGRVIKVQQIKVPYLETRTPHFDMHTLIGPGSVGSYAQKVEVPGLQIDLESEHPVKKLIYVPVDICSPVRGGDTINARVIAEEYVKLPTPYVPERYGPVGGWKDVPPKTHVRRQSGLLETMHAVEIHILDNMGNVARIDSGRFPSNVYIL